MRRQTSGPMRKALKQDAKSWFATVETLCDDIDVLVARVHLLERKLAWHNISTDSCRTCEVYSSGCGSPGRDGICKNSFSRHTTMMGVPDRIWAHVTEDDVCEDYIPTKAVAEGDKND